MNFASLEQVETVFKLLNIRRVSDIPFEELSFDAVYVSALGTIGKLIYTYPKVGLDDDNSIEIHWDNGNKSRNFHYMFDKVLCIPTAKVLL